MSRDTVEIARARVPLNGWPVGGHRADALLYPAVRDDDDEPVAHDLPLHQSGIALTGRNARWSR